MRHWVCEHASDCVCAAVVSVSSAVSFLRMGSLRVVTVPDPGRLSTRATLHSRSVTPWAGRSGKQRNHDAAVTHVQCQRAHTCLRAARASLVHERHWVCEHASDCVCAAVVSVSSAVSFLRMGSLRVVTVPDPGRLSARATLFPNGECNHPRPPQFAVQPRVSGRMGPERALLPSYQGSTLTTGLSPLESLESHTQSGG